MAKTRRRKKRTHVEEVPDPAKKKEPRTFIFRRGKLATPLADLEMDLRRMMQPNTAMNLKETRRNTIRDFVQVAGPLGVSHLLVLTATEKSSYLRVAKSPQGPTLTLRIRGWSLMRDVQSAQIRPRAPQTAFATSPLVVLSGFTGEEHLKLASVLLQAMFPSINIKKVKLSTCQRVVLLSRDKETGYITLRHYTISVTPSGVRKSVKGLLMRKDLPDLGDCEDVAEFITKSGYGSESEGEDAEVSRVSLAQDLGHGNSAGHTSRVRLHEVGPRLDLELLKIEAGLCGGQVLYHAHVAKTPEEAATLQARHEEQRSLKESRRRQQEENVRRKEALKKAKAEAKKAAELAKRGDKAEQQKQKWAEQQQRYANPTSGGGPDSGSDSDEDDHPAVDGGAGRKGGSGKRRRSAVGDDEDDDAAYFEEEVGHAPEDTDMVGRGPVSGGRAPSLHRRGRGGGRRGGGRGAARGGAGGGGGRGGGRGSSKGFPGRGGGRGRGRGGGRGSQRPQKKARR